MWGAGVEFAAYKEVGEGMKIIVGDPFYWSKCIVGVKVGRLECKAFLSTSEGSSRHSNN